MAGSPRYTCAEYREEMRLIGLQRRLREDASLTEAEREKIRAEIRRLETEMGMD
jgi:hypothetical protein